MDVYTTTAGLLVRGEPIEPADVVAQVWTREVGGGVDSGASLGRSNSLRDAEKLALAAGYTLRKPHPRYLNGVIYVSVFDTRLP